MTTLDQAFIKAFSRQGVVPLPPSSRQTPPAEENQTPPVAKEPARPLGVGRSEADRVLAALEQPLKQEAFNGHSRTSVELPHTSSNSFVQERECQVSTLPQLDFNTQQTVVSTGPWSNDSGAWNSAVESCCIEAPVTTPTLEPESVAESVDVVEESEPVVPPPASSEPPPGPSPAAHETPPAPTFKPAWQVDRFTWPKVCRRLIGRAADELDRLADALTAAHSSGHQVVAMAGWRQGEGATTLLLCAARRLAERGIKAVLVDADQNRPRLAKRLGVQPQFGWTEATGDDPGELSQAVVEAAANNLAIAPLNEPSAHGGNTTSDWSHFGPFLDTLIDHYEMVLVDPGPLANPQSVLDAPKAAHGGPIDAVLLVRNQRISSDADLSQAERRLDDAGVAVLGVIENFVVS